MTELVSSVAEKVIEKLGSIAYQEICLAWGIESDLKNLKLTMSAIQAKLLDAEERQAKERGLRVWLGQLKDVFYDAVDVLDEFECEALRKQVVKTYGSTGKKVRRFFSRSNPLAFRFKMGHRMKEIRERLEGIKKLSDQYNLQERQPDDKHIVVRETHSFIPDSDVIGREKDKQEIIDLLMQPGDDGNVSVIPIVGLGGMGKTTLAQSVYNDEMVKRNFLPRVWVCVSVDFDVKKLAKEILKSAARENSEKMHIDENMRLDEVQASLRNVLKGKKFLIVLDGVWNENRNKWNDLKTLLTGAKGSKILVTTRSKKVASVMAFGPIHELKGLPKDDCLRLFLRCAFKEGENKDPKLVEFGDQIVRKCGGVPLAVKTLGSILYSKTDELEWISVRDNEIWKLEQEENDILPALRLSYNKLPLYLKHCFAYCSLYPKDYEYNSVELIQSWMANGLLQKPNKSTRELEDIGQQYASELLARSFFQEVEVNAWSSSYETHTLHGKDPNNFVFKIHDLLHDLSLYVAQNDFCFIRNTNTTNNYDKARYVSILGHNLGLDEVTMMLQKLKDTVWTLILPSEFGHPINIKEFPLEICMSRFKYMRLLDLRCSTFEALPSTIGTLKHLRYLDLRWNEHIKKFPNSICELQNLETLMLDGCKELEELPRDIRKMISLRYLLILTKQMCFPHNGIGCLRSLRTLIFHNCPKLEYFLDRIQHLTALRRLSFARCESLISLPSGMKDLTRLETLVISDCIKLTLMEGEDYPVSLRLLLIDNLPQLVALPRGLKRSASTLQFLSIGNCHNLVALPEWLPDLSSLQTLEISHCGKLSSFPEGMLRLTALKKLEINNCNKLSWENGFNSSWPIKELRPNIEYPGFIIDPAWLNERLEHPQEIFIC